MPSEKDPYAPKILQEGNQWFLYSPLRKKKLHFTPEEWARQRIVNYLLHKKNYPQTLIAEEKKLPNSRLRFDLLVYSPELDPFLIIEVKAPYVLLSEKVLLQALSYTQSVQAPYLAMSNGTKILSYELNARKFFYDFPEYQR